MKNDERKAGVLSVIFCVSQIIACFAHSLTGMAVSTAIFMLILAQSASRSKLERRLRKYQHAADRRIADELEK